MFSNAVEKGAPANEVYIAARRYKLPLAELDVLTARTGLWPTRLSRAFEASLVFSVSLCDFVSLRGNWSSESLIKIGRASCRERVF